MSEKCPNGTNHNEYDPAPCPCCDKEPIQVLPEGTAECANPNCSVLQYEANRSVSSDTDHDVRPDGGHVRTSDADLAAHEHATALEAALDYVMEAVRRARDGDVADGAVARLELAECGTRLAFYATTAEARTVGIHDATEHLKAAVERIDEDSVGHLVRHALQLFAGYEDGDQQ